MSELKKLAEQVEGRGFTPIIVFDSTDGELTSVCWKQADRAYGACANDDGTLSVIGLTAGQIAMATLGSEHDQPCDAIDVLRSIDQLRRDLSGYHGQLKAHNDLQAHCDRQREQLAALGAAHKPVKAERDAYKRQAERLAAENAELREQIYWLKNGDMLHVLTDQELADQQKHEREVQASITALESENAKLRDAMYANAGKHSLQHMDEDELRIWATQQSEYIEELKELAREMRSDLLPTTCPWADEYDRRMRELGVNEG